MAINSTWNINENRFGVTGDFDDCQKITKTVTFKESEEASKRSSNLIVSVRP